MSTVIRVEGVGKRYRLGVINRKMFYEDIQSRWARFRKKPDPHSLIVPHIDKAGKAPTDEHSEFWALRDISFEVKDGEAVAIIGHNGAGKSTLLKILAEVTAPTCGRILMKGRVASLLEVGTGFHPELTGRDNVYLNGAILGMAKREIARKYDEIAVFSGVEEFLDTPVKRYSSGMRVRLAFAVAAHLEPEILIIDEVLAVGDAAFQQKCIGKLSDVASQGRTILFVSHNMAAVENLCTRGLVLDSGGLIFEGSQTEAIAHYLAANSPQQSDLAERKDRAGTGELIVTEVTFGSAGKKNGALCSGQDAELRLFFTNSLKRLLPMLTVSLTVKNHFDVPVFTQHNHLSGQHFAQLPAKGAFICRIPRLPLPESIYRVSYQIRSHPRRGELIDQLENAAECAVAAGNFHGSGLAVPPRQGLTLVDAEWRVENAFQAVIEEPRGAR